MLQISQKQLEKFRQVKNLYFNKTKVPAADNWQDWNDDDVWCHLVSQVITVGNSFPAQRFEKKRARYELLEEGTVRKTIAKKPPHVNHPVYVITAKGRRAYDETSKVRARPLKLSDF
jgi:hypothetical protein